MSRGPVWIVGLVSVLVLGCLHTPVLWSPDGRWLAYTMAVEPGGRIPAPWWLFETNGGVGFDLSEKPVKRPGAPTSYRLWATQVETGESFLLEESRGPLSSPGWSPEGKALAFGRIVPEPEGRARYEVVILDGPGRRRVLFSRPYSNLDPRVDDLPRLTPAWSPDGRFLAVPIFQQSLGLAILRADNGRVLKLIEGGYWPSWSPDKSMLAFMHNGEPETLQCLDTTFGPPRTLAEIGQTYQPPVWSSDSRSILVVSGVSAEPAGVARSPFSRPPVFPRDPTAAHQPKLIRVPVDRGRPVAIALLAPDHLPREKTFYGTSFSADRDGENIFFANDIEGEPTQISWFRSQNGETYKRFHPFDVSIRIGALAVNPNGRTLAFRVGPPGALTAPALCDPTSNQVMPVTLVPDDAARIGWLTTLVAAGRDLLRSNLPPAIVSGNVVDRPSVLPIPGELAASHEVSFRLRRLGRIGRPLCDRPADAAPADPALSALLDEARFFFDYLRGDFTAALDDLDALDARAQSTDHRLRLLSLRAQVFLGLGQTERAERTIRYLNKTAPPQRKRLEMTPAGWSIALETAPGGGWPAYLLEKAGELARRTGDGSAGSDELPLGHRNPDNPDAVFGPAAAIPFAPVIPAAVAPEMPVLRVVPEEFRPPPPASGARRPGPRIPSRVRPGPR
jgi:hypothetical protein